MSQTLCFYFGFVLEGHCNQTWMPASVVAVVVAAVVAVVVAAAAVVVVAAAAAVISLVVVGVIAPWKGSCLEGRLCWKLMHLYMHWLARTSLHIPHSSSIFNFQWIFNVRRQIGHLTSYSRLIRNAWR